MAVTAADLLNRVGATSDAESLALATTIVGKAALYVTRYRENNELDPETPAAVPETIADGAVLACAEDIWERTKSQHGIVLTNYQPGDDSSGVTVRIGRDPLAPVRPLLAPWYPPAGFA